MKTARFASVILSAMLAAGPTAAQRQGESLADAARRVRQQKAQAAKATRVYTNDNMPSGPVTGTGSAAATPEGGESPAGVAGAAPGGSGAAASGDEKERADTEAEIAATRERLAVLKKDVELLIRDYDLQRQQHYGDPDYAAKKGGKTALDGLQGQMAAKRQEVQQAEQKLAALEEKLKQLNQSLGEKASTPATADDRRAGYLSRLQPLRQELARVEAEISRIRSEAAAQGQTLYGTSAGSGGFTSNMLGSLEQRRRELQQQIAAIEDEARRAGFSGAAVR